MATALVPDVPGLLILRFLTGFFNYASITNIGGTIADLWQHHDTGMPRSVYMVSAIAGSPFGVFVYSFIGQLHGLRAVWWGMMGITGGIIILNIVCIKETRHSVILRRRCTRLKEGTGNDSLDVPEEMRAQMPTELLRKSMLRPFYLLFTEPVIMFTAAYNTYIFGLIFLFNGAFTLVFGEMGHGFNTIEVGLLNLGMSVGVLIGPVTHRW